MCKIDSVNKTTWTKPHYKYWTGNSSTVPLRPPPQDTSPTHPTTISKHSNSQPDRPSSGWLNVLCGWTRPYAKLPRGNDAAGGPAQGVLFAERLGDHTKNNLTPNCTSSSQFGGAGILGWGLGGIVDKLRVQCLLWGGLID